MDTDENLAAHFIPEQYREEFMARRTSLVAASLHKGREARLKLIEMLEDAPTRGGMLEPSLKKMLTSIENRYVKEVNISRKLCIEFINRMNAFLMAKVKVYLYLLYNVIHPWGYGSRSCLNLNPYLIALNPELYTNYCDNKFYVRHWRYLHKNGIINRNIILAAVVVLRKLRAIQKPATYHLKIIDKIVAYGRASVIVELQLPRNDNSI
jgi:hypothetical protein